MQTNVLNSPTGMGLTTLYVFDARNILIHTDLAYPSVIRTTGLERKSSTISPFLLLLHFYGQHLSYSFGMCLRETDIRTVLSARQYTLPELTKSPETLESLARSLYCRLSSISLDCLLAPSSPVHRARLSVERQSIHARSLELLRSL